MNMRVMLLGNIIIFNVFLLGCSKNTSDTQNQALYEMTMTKVQNDVNEIMDKESNYVLENMGKPYITTYFINTQDINIDKIDEIKELSYTSDKRFVYPKENTNITKDSSSIVVNIKDDLVESVNTHQIGYIYNIKEDSSMEKEMSNNTKTKEKTDKLVINEYNKEKLLCVENINEDELKESVGRSIATLEQMLQVENPDIDMYLENSDSKLRLYIVDGKTETDKYITIYTEKDIIKELNITNGLSLLYLLQEEVKKIG